MVLLNNQFIQGIQFDWDKIDEDSYLMNIEALQGVERLNFLILLLFLLVKMAVGNQLYLRQ